LSIEQESLRVTLEKIREYTLATNLDHGHLSPDELQPYTDLSNQELVHAAGVKLQQAQSDSQGDPLVLLAEFAAIQYVIETRLAT